MTIQMSRYLTGRTALLLACLVLPAFAKGAPDRSDQSRLDASTPERSFSLYVRFTEGDPHAIEKIAALNEVPAHDLDELRSLMIHTIMFGDTPHIGEEAQLREEYVRELKARMRAMKCRTIGSKQEVREDVYWATVDYTCQLPDIAAVTPRLTRVELQMKLEEDSLTRLRIDLDRLRKAPSIARTGSVEFSQDAGTKEWVPTDLPSLRTWVLMMAPLSGLPGEPREPSEVNVWNAKHW
ncbi:TPA: hypothetical protein UMF63_001469 [Stenotrophomonas maltophilia]|nr:hypothetical protein [Stenotrophomonas maltophilia]